MFAEDTGLAIWPAYDEFRGYLGFGWGFRDVVEGRNVRWIDHLEGELNIPISEPADMQIALLAAPLFLDWRQQNIGVYVNGKFAVEWICPHSSKFEHYSATIPLSFWRTGGNSVVFRMGYRRRDVTRTERNELAIAVYEVRFFPEEAADEVSGNNDGRAESR